MVFLMGLVLSFSAFALNTYKCVNGNNPSICDQEVVFNKVNGKLISLDVIYAGDCAGQGPFNYECKKNICADDNIIIKIKDESHYHWENRPYGFVCDFEKK